MQENKIQILSTGSISQQLIQQAAKNNIIIDAISFIKTEEVVDETVKQKIIELSQLKDVIVFTSANAVHAVSKCLSEKPSWRIFCIGNTTKELVNKTFGKESIMGFADNARELSIKVLQDASIKNITFFCGDKRRDDLPSWLKINGISIDEIIVYKTIETPTVLTKKYDGILFFSPSAVKSFFSKNSIDINTKVFAIGDTTSNELQLFTQQPVIIAEIPGKENLINTVTNHFSKSNIH